MESPCKICGKGMFYDDYCSYECGMKDGVGEKYPDGFEWGDWYMSIPGEPPKKDDICDIKSLDGTIKINVGSSYIKKLKQKPFKKP